VCHAGGLNNIAGEEKHTLKRDALERYGLYDLEAITTQVHLISISQVLTPPPAPEPLPPPLPQPLPQPLPPPLLQ